MRTDLTLLEDLTRDNVDDMLSCECDLLPPDLAQRCSKSKKETYSREDVASLLRAIESTQKDIAQKEQQLTQLKAGSPNARQRRHQHPRKHQRNPMHLVKTLCIHLETGTQLIDGLVRACRSDLDDLLNMPRPSSNNVGDATKRVAQQFQQVQQMLTSMKTANEAHGHISTTTAADLRSLLDGQPARHSSKGVAYAYDAVQSLRNDNQVLAEASRLLALHAV